MDSAAIERDIRSAFAGVTLGTGISIRQSEAIEDYREHVTEAEYVALPHSETTDDWTAVPAAELKRAAVPHFDLDGLRYYLPALLVWVLHSYDRFRADPLFDGDMAIILTIQALAPEGDRERQWQIFDGFTDEQKAAIALFVVRLPECVQLRRNDQVRLDEAARVYWSRFLTH